jgi:hypothetical protein
MYSFWRSTSAAERTGAGVVRPLHRHQRDDDLVHALAQHREQHKGDQDRRERQLDVGDAHDHRVGEAAEVRRGETEHQADREGEERARHPTKSEMRMP